MTRTEETMLFDRLKSGKRKIYFIKKDFQSRFILRFAAVATVWAGATVVLFSYLAGKRLDELRYSSRVDIKTMSDLLLPITIGAHVVSLLIFAGILAYTIRSLWKRLTPPLFSIKKDIARIAGGDLMSAVSLSKNEEFEDIAAELDGMRVELREKIVKIKAGQQALSAAAAEFARAVYEGTATPSHAASLQSAAARMHEDIRAFHYSK
jgi:methyl-accepting chemotaxis protein